MVRRSFSLVGRLAVGVVCGLSPRSAIAATAPGDPEAQTSPSPKARPRVDGAPRVVPDLGIVRYADPAERRAAWLGFDLAASVVPRQLGLFDRTVWLVRGTPAWALALTPWLAVGGRHGLAWYDAGNARSRIHEHQLELSGQPAFRRASIQDRLAIGVETHNFTLLRVGGVDFKIAGIKDVVATLGYGMDHELARRWTLGWQLQLRHVWVFLDTQRQARLSVRVAFLPRPGHRLALEAIGFLVHRDEDQAGEPLPRTGLYGQIALDYTWMSRHNVGLTVRPRFASSFLSGEAPVYEIREEALDNMYADILVGFRAVWR